DPKTRSLNYCGHIYTPISCKIRMTLKMITVNYPPQRSISEISTTALMSFSVIKQSLMILDLWLRYQIE
ncbi:ubiquitin specific peptidase 7, partial [Homo sapiens]